MVGPAHGFEADSRLGRLDELAKSATAEFRD